MEHLYFKPSAEKFLKVQQSRIPLNTNYNLLDKTNFSNLYAILDGTLKEIKRLEIDTARSYENLINDELKIILHNSTISPNIKGKAKPNANICKYISMRSSNCTTKEFYLDILTNTLACGIDISEKNISNYSGYDIVIQSIFNAGNEEVEVMAISVMQRLTETIDFKTINNDDE
ncbi:hypothetical protein C1645_838400 [Glomus cerebriforme]|uniref:Uncharacterized protein n=1 Tax=Glomus cerebriforme TaxID=658196 RepID=A0A397S775_9GLOM|nr:hypothetical protein C1645_838400 [Glomus cerebriforme]